MTPLQRSQFIYRLTGEDFRPRVSLWLRPVLRVLCALLIAIALSYVWK